MQSRQLFKASWHEQKTVLHQGLSELEFYGDLVDKFQKSCAGRGSSIGSVSAWHESGPEFDPHTRHILSWRLGHENISTAILPLPLST